MVVGGMIALLADLVNGLSRVAWATGGPNGQLTVSGDERPCFALIKAYLCRGSLSHLTPSAPHAGTGGARRPGDQRQDFLEHPPRDCDLGHLER